MGFLSGLVTGVAVSALGAAWYMSRSASKIRDQYRVEERLGELGDQLEARTRDLQARVDAQLTEMRKGKDDGATNGHDAGAIDAAADAVADAGDAAAETVKTTVAKGKAAAAEASDAAG